MKRLLLSLLALSTVAQAATTVVNLGSTAQATLWQMHPRSARSAAEMDDLPHWGQNLITVTDGLGEWDLRLCVFWNGNQVDGQGRPFRFDEVFAENEGYYLELNYASVSGGVGSTIELGVVESQTSNSAVLLFDGIVAQDLREIVTHNDYPGTFVDFGHLSPAGSSFACLCGDGTVPEPSTALLTLFGAMFLACRRR